MARQPFSNLEYATRDEYGDLRWLCINGEPVFDEDGKFTGYQGTGTDKFELTDEKATTAVGFVQLCAELLKAGVIDDPAVSRIKDAIAKDIIVTRTAT